MSETKVITGHIGIPKQLTAFQALYIKVLRVKYDYTWRAVHREWCTRYRYELPFNSSKIEEVRDGYVGNQLAGMRLCDKAARMLDGEDFMKGEWN